MIDKLRKCFDEMVVYKDLKTSNCFSALSLPSFMRDWLLRRFEDETGAFNMEELVSFVHDFIPRRDDWTAIKNRIIKENERVKLLAKISVDIDIRTGEVSFSLPDFGLSAHETIIEDFVWNLANRNLSRGENLGECLNWLIVRLMIVSAHICQEKSALSVSRTFVHTQLTLIITRMFARIFYSRMD